jgi:hypothetical protein
MSTSSYRRPTKETNMNRSFRPQLEALEDRLVPSTLLLDRAYRAADSTTEANRSAHQDPRQDVVASIDGSGAATLSAQGGNAWGKGHGNTCHLDPICK